MRASLVAQMVKNLLAVQESQLRSRGREDPLEEGKATHSSILAWRIPWTEEPGGLQSMGSQRARHDWSDLECIHAPRPEARPNASLKTALEQKPFVPCVEEHWSRLENELTAETDEYRERHTRLLESQVSLTGVSYSQISTMVQPSSSSKRNPAGPL